MDITACEIDNPWGFAVRHRELNPVLCDNLEGWNRVENGREVQEGGERCIPVADSC